MATIAVRVYNCLTVMAEYIEMAMKNAKFEELEDGTYYAELSRFQGVWAEGETITEAREELREVLQEWIEMRLPDNDLGIPVVGGINVRQLL